MKNLETLSDKKLVSLMNNDQKDKAFGILYERYFGKILNYCNSFCHETENSRDLAQETFVKLYNGCDSFNDKWAFSTWIYAIAKNNLVDNVRKNKNWDNLVFSLDRNFSVDNHSDDEENHNKKISLLEDDNPESVMVRNQRNEFLRNYIFENRLGNSKYSDILKLKYYDELSYDEIADFLEIPVGTVKARLFRAHDLLRERLMKNANFSSL